MLNRIELFENICDVALHQGHNAWKIEQLYTILGELNEWSRSIVKELDTEVIRVFPKYRTLSKENKTDLLKLVIRWAKKELKETCHA
jgi:hypothetical protein